MSATVATTATKGSGLARMKRSFRPPRKLKFTSVGKVFVVVTVGIGIAALNTGNNLLYLVLGFLLSLIVVSGVLSERVLRSVEARRLPSDPAFSGEAVPVRWELQSKKSALFAVAISEDGGPLQVEAKIAYVPAQGSAVIRADAVAPRRGVHTLERLRIATSFPFGLFTKSLTLEAPGSLTVLPKRHPEAATGARHSATDVGAHEDAPRPGGSGDLYELVELRADEDARRVHWLKSAALGKLVRAEREIEREQVVMLQVHSTGDRDQDDVLCERLGVEVHGLLRRGVAVGLEADHARLRPASGSPQELRLLVALAELGLTAPEKR